MVLLTGAAAASGLATSAPNRVLWRLLPLVAAWAGRGEGQGVGRAARGEAYHRSGALGWHGGRSSCAGPSSLHIGSAVVGGCRSAAQGHPAQAAEGEAAGAQMVLLTGAAAASGLATSAPSRVLWRLLPLVATGVAAASGLAASASCRVLWRLLLLVAIWAGWGAGQYAGGVVVVVKQWIEPPRHATWVAGQGWFEFNVASRMRAFGRSACRSCPAWRLLGLMVGGVRCLGPTWLTDQVNGHVVALCAAVGGSAADLAAALRGVAL